MKNATISTTSRCLVTSLAAVGFSLLVASDASAQSTWGQASGGTYDWNNSGNWTGGIPNAAGATAQLTNAITGPVTVDLGSTNETTGTLKIGASTANTFTLSSTGGGVLIFRSTAGTTGTGITEASNNADIISAPLQINDTGGLTITDTASTATLTISGGITSAAGAENLVIKSNGGGSVLLSTGSINNQGTITNSGTGTNTTVISSTIGSNVTGVTQSGTFSALTLSGANSSYAGTTTLTTGTLNIANAAALGTGTLTISGGTLDNTSSGSLTNSGNNAININGNFTYNGTQSLNLGSGAVAATTGSKTITVNANTLELDGTITGAGTMNLVKQGSGTLVLGGNGSTWSGSTTDGGGTLLITGSVN
ncbi:MAG TPA: hypothetical protein VIM71_07665, partial [Lacunisphaera sp.]